MSELIMKQRIDDKDFSWFDDEQSFSLDKEYFNLFPNLFENDGYNDLSAYLSILRHLCMIRKRNCIMIKIIDTRLFPV